MPNDLGNNSGSRTIILALGTRAEVQAAFRKSTMDEQIKTITQKIKELKRKDPGFQVFGASAHRYMNNGRLYEEEVRSFEKSYNIRLPIEYREFILQIGNGGVGPYYGLESLEDGILKDLDHRRKTGLINPALEFPFSEAWNLEYWNIEDAEESAAMEEEYFDAKWANGLLRISNFGCGVSMNIVVNGKEYGNIWVDDRYNDGGIFPDSYFGNKGRITFLAWYELWLDKSLSEVGAGKYSTGSLSDPVKQVKPWWKALLNKKR